MPKSLLGKYAFGLLIIFLLCFVTTVIGVNSGIIPEGIMICVPMLITGPATFITGLISFKKNEDRSPAIILTIIIGAIAVLFIVSVIVYEVIDYISGSASTSLRTLVWVDKEGNEEQIDAEPNNYSFPKISPNGNEVALSIRDPGNQNQEIFIWDEVRKILNKRTFDKSTRKLVPIWTPDGERIVYYSNHENPRTGGIYWRPANGTGKAEKLVSIPDRHLIPYSFSNDGKILVMHEFVTSLNLDISILSMEDGGERKLLLQTEFIEGQPKISPDNQYIAYVCDESDQMEIYVSPLLDVKKGKWQISQGGGTSPLWSPDGKELFYLGLDNSVMAVDVETKPIFDYGTPKKLFQSKYVGFSTGKGTSWDIHPDGKRFLMMKTTTATDAATVVQRPKINIVLNWDEELKQRVPVY